jgi:hypothetical protein
MPLCEVTVRKAIEASLPHVANSFRGQPLIEARLRQTLGRSFRYLGEPGIAQEQLEAARALFAKFRGPDHPDTLTSMWGLAKDLTLLHRDAEAVPVLDDCLRRSVGKRIHRNFPEVADLRLRHFEKANDAAGCRTTAELWEKQQRTDAASLYKAAVCRAVTAKVVVATDPSTAAAEAERAVNWLKQAMAAGYKGNTSPKADPDLAVLCDRVDFQTLMADLKPGR